MDSFCFSHYPMSTRRKGKRPLSAIPENDNDDETTSDVLNVNHEMAPPLAKRLKIAKDGETTTTSSLSLPSIMQDHYGINTPERPKRDFEVAFGGASHDACSVMTPPMPQRARFISNDNNNNNNNGSGSQSAGQVTTESPLPAHEQQQQQHYEQEESNHHYHHCMMMNGFLGQLHAERQQRLQQQQQQDAGVEPLSCPLTQGMHAMSIQSSTTTTPRQHRSKHVIYLHTDSKLA